MSRIILASSSPRRKELMAQEGIDFIVDAASIEEVLDESLSVEERLKKLALDKGMPIHEKYPDDVVIAADTTVYHHDQIIGKAHSREEAKAILTSLSNDRQIVYTSVAIFFPEETLNFIEKTTVVFKDITDMIDDYLDTNEWVGKAGAYAIQGKGDRLIASVDGDIDTVIGLPVKKIKTILQNHHVL